jgi:acyl carrier protein
MEEINIEMADILEVDFVSDDDELKDFVGWDSLAILSLLAFIDDNYDVQLGGEDFETIRSLSDVKKLVQAKS